MALNIIQTSRIEEIPEYSIVHIMFEHAFGARKKNKSNRRNGFSRSVHIKYESYTYIYI